MKVIKHNYIFNRTKPVLFKSNDFMEILTILESVYYDNEFNQENDSKFSRQLLKLIDTLYKVTNNIKIYESEIYKDNFKWGDVDNIIFGSSDELTISKINLEIDDYILERQIDVLNKLHDGDSINIDDLSSLQGKDLRSLDNDLKDFIYQEEKFWNVLRQNLMDLSIQEYAQILFFIEGVLSLKLFINKYTQLYPSLIKIKIKILNLFKEIYSSIDYFV